MTIPALVQQSRNYSLTNPNNKKMVGELGVAPGVGWSEGLAKLLKDDCVKVPQGSYMRDLHKKAKEVSKTSWVFLHVFGYLKGLDFLIWLGVLRIQEIFSTC